MVRVVDYSGLKTAVLRGTGGSKPSSPLMVQKDFTKVVILASKISYRCKIKVLQRFFFVYTSIA